MSSTHRGAVRSPNDYYGTPAWLTDAILPHLPLGGVVLEPCAGKGQILMRLLRAGVNTYSVRAYEIDPVAAAECERVLVPANVIPVHVRDFLAVNDLGHIDTVVMNPPYDVAEQPGCTAFAFVKKCVDHVGPSGTVAALLRLNWLEGAGHGEPERLAFLKRNPPDIGITSRRPAFGTNKHGKIATDSCAYAWMVWGPGRCGRIFYLDVAGAEPEAA